MTHANASLASVLGKSYDELIGKNLSSFLAEGTQFLKDHDHLTIAIEQALKTALGSDIINVYLQPKASSEKMRL